MSNQMGVLLSAGIFFLFALVFLVIAEVNKRITEKNPKLYQGKAQGEILEIIKSGTNGVGGIGLYTSTLWEMTLIL